MNIIPKKNSGILSKDSKNKLLSKEKDSKKKNNKENEGNDLENEEFSEDINEFFSDLL